MWSSLFLYLGSVLYSSFWGVGRGGWRLLRVSWTAKRSNQSILKKINPEYSVEKTVLYICVSFAVSHTGLSLPSFYHLIRTDLNVFFLIAEYYSFVYMYHSFLIHFSFPVVMYGCESWTIKKAEHWRIDGFELWCWRRLLRIPCSARRDNQSILKEIRPECSLEGLMLKLKLQYFGHLM